MRVRVFLRSRRKLWAFGGACLGVGLTALDLFYAVVAYIPQYRYRNDFRLMYGAALTGLNNGYAHLYDLAAQRSAVEGIGPGFYWSPFINPPPLAWVATPFTALPFTVAVVLWSALIAGALWLTWYLLAPGDSLTKAAYGLLWIGLFPAAFGLMVGQPVALVAAAVAGCWWLAERDRPVLAGVALSAIALKPQVALLVPLCLLVAGQARLFGAWLVVAGFMVLVSLALLGHDGVARYRDALALASQWEITRRYAVSGPLGTGPQLYVAEAIAVVAAVAAAWRWRHTGPGVPIAAGITGSLLFTPYVGFQDFAMLVVAGWLVIRAQPSGAQVALLVVGYALLEFALLVLALPILLAEVLFLASMIWPGQSVPDPARSVPNVLMLQPDSAPLVPDVPKPGSRLP